jgi:hypothetical protein
MKKPKKSKKSSEKKMKAGVSTKVAPKAKLAAKKKPGVKAKAVVKGKPAAKATVVPKSAPVVKAKAAPKKKARRAAVATAQVGSQDVEIVQVKAKARVARAGAGGGDFGGASLVEGANSESVDELLEEGQSFEAGIVRGVEEADDEIEQEVHTHEVPQGDVPGEYDDDERPN